jgi:hypothetical protein
MGANVNLGMQKPQLGHTNDLNFLYQIWAKSSNKSEEMKLGMKVDESGWGFWKTAVY